MPRGHPSRTKALIVWFGRPPATGDIVIFHPVKGVGRGGLFGDDVFIKRIVAVAGDTIEVRRAGPSLQNSGAGYMCEDVLEAQGLSARAERFQKHLSKTLAAHHWDERESWQRYVNDRQGDSKQDWGGNKCGWILWYRGCEARRFAELKAMEY